MKFGGPGGSMSQVVGLPNNSYKPITNTVWVRARLCKLQKGCTRLAAASAKVYQLLAHGRWFPPGTPASSTTKTGRHDIAEIFLKGGRQTEGARQLLSISRFKLYALFINGKIEASLYKQSFIIYKCRLLQGPLCLQLYGSFIYNYLFNQWLSPPKLRVLNPVHDDVYSIQHYVIKFVSVMRQVGGFLRVLQFPLPIKLTTTIQLKYF